MNFNYFAGQNWAFLRLLQTPHALKAFHVNWSLQSLGFIYWEKFPKYIEFTQYPGTAERKWSSEVLQWDGFK